MKFRWPALVALLAGVLAFSPYFFSSTESSSSEESAMAPMGNGTPDDPNARSEYEQMRHADPATGEIPANIRARELQFASRLPVKDQAKSLNWDRRGPFNKGGRTRAMALDVLDENIILAGGVTGGVWRSTDGGQNWVITTAPDQIHSVTTIAQDTRPGMENVWYYGTGESYGIVSGTSFTSRFSGDGIFKSTDSGQSWVKLASTESGTPETFLEIGDFDFVWNIVLDHTDLNNDVVLAAVYDGIFRSTDGGTTWNSVLGVNVGAGQASTYVALEQTTSGVFYATLSNGGQDEGMYRSTDGINWVDIMPAGYPSSHSRQAIAINPSNEDEVYFLSLSPGNGATGHNLWKYTYLSGDGSGTGGQWENRTSNLPNTDCLGYFTFNFGPFNSQSGYDLCMTVHPSQPDVLYIGGTNIYRSTNGFTSQDSTEWIGGYYCDSNDPSNYVYPNHHPDQHLMFFSPSNPNVMYSANDGGVYRTDDDLADSVIWTPLNNGYFTTQFYTVAMEGGAATSDIIIGGMQDNGTWFTNSTTSTAQWVEVGIDDGAYCAIAEGRDHYVISSQQGRIYLKDVDDNGNILATQRIDPSAVGGSAYSFINPFILDAGNNDILYIAAGARIWRNDDLSTIPLTNDIYNPISTNWTGLSGSQLGLPDGSLTCLETSESAPNTLYFGTSSGKLYRLDDSQGANPAKVAIGSSNFPNAYMSCVALNPHDSSELVATFAPYGVQSIFHSQDGGQTWTHVGGNLEENPDGTGVGPAVYWAEIYPSYPHPTYLVGTSVGLFSTTNPNGDGTVWEMEGPSTIGNRVINMIVSRTGDGKVVVGTHGGGVYSANISPAVVGVEGIDRSGQIGLQVLPNPASVNTQIRYEVAEAGPVLVEVLDLEGKQIATLWSGTQAAGEQQVPWRHSSTSDLSAGVYLVRVQTADGSQQVQKIVKR